MRAASSWGSGTAQAQKKFEGVEINLLTRPGPVIAGRLEERGREYQEMTGAKVTVATVPFADLFQKLLTDWATGTNSIDVGVFASGWAVELVDGGLLADLSDFVANDPDLNPDDIAPYFREFNQKIDGRPIWITIDGDFQMVYYRTDVLEELGLEPPKTWDEYLEVAAAANGKDMNGDGEADFGSCMFKKRNAQSYYAIMTIAAPYVQSQGTGQGIFFNTDDMTPMVNNEAWAKAFEFYKVRQVRPAGGAQPRHRRHPRPGHQRPLRPGDRLGRHRPALDRPDLQNQGLVGAVISPGSTQVLDWASGKLVDCTPTLCLCHRRREPRTFRSVRRLVRRDQRQLRPEGDRGRLRLPVVHEPGGAIEHRRHHGLDRLQPLSDLPVRARRPVGRGRLLAGSRRRTWARSVTA